MEIRKGNIGDTEKYIQLLQEVHSQMKHKEWFYLDPPEAVQEMIANGTMALWVATDGERLAAAFSVIFPGLTEMNYGYDLGFTDEELHRVVDMDTIAVHPDYRGRGLQYKLMQMAERDAAQSGDRILLCTVHPDNRFSLENILRQGYTIEKKLEKYGSVRYILRKDISDVFAFRELTQHHAMEIADKWKYDAEYAFYDMTADPEDYEEFTSEMLRDRNDYYEAALNGKLAGYFCVFRSGSDLEIGLGLRPDLCGQGRGRQFLNQILAFTAEKYEFENWILSVAAFNQRAIKVYRACGFEEYDRSIRSTNGGKYEFLTFKKNVKKSEKTVDKLKNLC